ncbi:MAG: GNAT family N-acetyltransferase [Bacteroidales bacterium]|nr:GNAT family N-acetyltransferase [Bacteroidales bacterium]
MEFANSSESIKYFAIEIGGRLAGSIGLHIQTNNDIKNAEMGYWLAEVYHGKGIVTDAVKAITAMAFGQFQIGRIFATPFSNNPASIKVLEKAGYIY